MARLINKILGMFGLRIVNLWDEDVKWAEFTFIISENTILSAKLKEAENENARLFNLMNKRRNPKQPRDEKGRFKPYTKPEK
jgi:hypothetical protein